MMCLISWSFGRNCVVGSIKKEQPPNFLIFISPPKPKLNLTTLSCKLTDRFNSKDSFALLFCRSCFLVPTLNIPQEIKSQKVLKLRKSKAKVFLVLKPGGINQSKEDPSLKSKLNLRSISSFSLFHSIFIKRTLFVPSKSNNGSWGRSFIGNVRVVALEVEFCCK
ncbi:hypothetical protein SLE2022_056380 [Rubroshorea leprosula]